MKTLKQILEVYKPKSADEKKFVDKHIVVKHKDRNGNGDDVFQATNIKTVGRKDERHGYDPNEDEKVYEEVENINEDPITGALIGTAIGLKAGYHAAKQRYPYEDSTKTFLGKFAKNAVKGLVDPRTYVPQAVKDKFKKKTNEEVKYVEEKAKWRTDDNNIDQEYEDRPTYVPRNNRPFQDQEQGTLTDRKGLPTRKLKKAIQSTLGTKRGRPIGRLPEETEHLEEKLKVSDGIGAWISDFVHSKNPNFAGKSKKERTQMALGAFYSAKRGE